MDTFKLLTSVALLALAPLFPAHAQVNALPDARHVLVYGEATARAVPDRFRLGMKFKQVDADAQRARDRLESSLATVLQQLSAAGVDERDVVATSLDVGPYMRYDNKREEQVYAGVAATRELTARFSDATTLEAFLASVKASEQVQITGIDTELSTEAQLREQLRTKSIEATRQKARDMAAAYGARITGLYSVSDVAPQFSYGIREGSWQGGYAWDGYARTLDKVEVTGSRAKALQTESLKVGYVDYSDKIYAVFLLAD